VCTPAACCHLSEIAVPPLAQDPDAVSQQAGAYAELAVEVHGYLGQEAKEAIQGCKSSCYKLKSTVFSVLLKKTHTHTQGSTLK